MYGYHNKLPREVRCLFVNSMNVAEMSFTEGLVVYVNPDSEKTDDVVRVDLYEKRGGKFIKLGSAYPGDAICWSTEKYSNTPFAVKGDIFREVYESTEADVQQKAQIE